MSDTEAFDRPASRGYDWQKLSREIKETRGKKCERCGEHNDNYEHFPVCFQTHHIVKGRHLPISVSRLAINLVVLCQRCHNRLEGKPAMQQYRSVGKVDMANTLQLLSIEETISPNNLCDTLDVDVFSAYGLLESARKLRLARRTDTGQYQIAPDKLPYNAIEKASEKDCTYTPCNRSACRKIKYRGLWNAYCQEHEPFENEAEAGLYELVADPRSEE